MDASQITLSFLLRWFLTILFASFIVKLLWERRWLYYYSAILPGPLSLPLIGSPSIVFSGPKAFLEFYPAVWRFWLGSHLCIVTTKAEHADYVLNNCLQKKNVPFYRYMEESYSSIASTNYERWRVHRKNLNPTFSPKLMEIYFGVFVKYTNQLLKRLEGVCGRKTSLVRILWENTVATVFDNLGEVDANTLSMKPPELVSTIIRQEELLGSRITNPIFYFKSLWEMSGSAKELALSKDKSMAALQEAVDRHPSSRSSVTEEELSTPNFINFLRKNHYAKDGIPAEMTAMGVAGSETTAIVTKSVLLALSIYPHIQEKLHEEVKNLPEGLTLQDLDNLNYLDRVVKETMRFLPPIPIIFRYVDKSFKIDHQVYPAGTLVWIPIYSIHRKPEYWPDPLKFDPDRFLPEEVEKRPRAAYLAFSRGARNCIGMRYGTVGVKVLVAKIVKEFEVERGELESLDDVETTYYLFAKPKDCYEVTLKKRKIC